MAPSPVEGAQVFVCTSVFRLPHGATVRRMAPMIRKPLISLRRDGADFLAALAPPCLFTGLVTIGPEVMP